MNKPVISSLLETDLYKFTMWQTLLHKFPANDSVYRFVCRNQTDYPLSALLPYVNEQLDMLCKLKFTNAELDYLGSLRFIKTDFVEFLRIFQLNRNFISAWAQGDELCLEAKGPQIHAMIFEIYVLAIVNELYYRFTWDGKKLIPAETYLTDIEVGKQKLASKIAMVEDQVPLIDDGTFNDFEISDFGLRRRYAGAWQDHVVHTLKAELPQYFKGTSNVYLAMKHDLTPIGTMAHEYLQTFQAVGVQLRSFQKEALEAWVQEYRGDLGIALTDVVGMDAFLNDFDLYFTKLFDGLRHDSGCPIEWGEKAIAHYQKQRIDPQTKRLTFSDGLDIPTCLKLFKTFGKRTKLGFGIGTNLTNDVGRRPLNIVMKLVNCNGQPVAKLSDSPGKTLCNDEVFLNYLRQVFNIKN